ncbi:hypothetical protein Tco_0388593 [Tanacetum coccineum]
MHILNSLSNIKSHSTHLDTYNELLAITNGINLPAQSRLSHQASSEFITDERVTMVEIEGIPLKVWNENTFIRIASKWGTLLNVENLEKENYHCKRLCVLTKNLDDQNDEESDSEDEECEEVFKKDFGESDEEVQGENDISRVSDT